MELPPCFLPKPPWSAVTSGIEYAGRTQAVDTNHHDVANKRVGGLRRRRANGDEANNGKTKAKQERAVHRRGFSRGRQPRSLAEVPFL